ncbi:MAG: OmpH family outer membrane protein [Nitrospiraceae bacterium]|nr:MAG: OmpH family outer membrane protein [Nitrospiraceae bacterium]
MKKVFCLFMLITLFMSVQPLYAADMKIGFVNLIKALNESESGKKAKTDLEFLINAIQKKVDEKGKTIEQLRADLEKQSSVLSEESRKSKEAELERLLRDYQRLVTDSQNDVKKKEGEFTANIIKELRKIIKKIGEEQGYTFILENTDGMVLYSQEALDLTDEVLKRYNASGK